MVLLSEGSSVKERPEDKQASAPCVKGSTFTWGPIFSVKSGPVYLEKGTRTKKGGGSL